MKYYALFDTQLDGFIGGYADSSLNAIVDNAFERIVELSDGNEEPFSKNDDPLEVLSTAGYEIHLVNEKDYTKIIDGSNLLFLSEPIKSIKNTVKVNLKDSKIEGYFTEVNIEEATASDVFAIYENAEGTPYAHIPQYGYKSISKDEHDSMLNGTYAKGAKRISLEKYKEISEDHELPNEFLKDRKVQVYNYLLEKGCISCSYDEFVDSSIEIHEHASDVFDSIYYDLDLYEADCLISTLKDVTPEQLKGFDSVEDYMVQSHEMVRYIKDLDVYLFLSDHVQFNDLDLF